MESGPLGTPGSTPPAADSQRRSALALLLVAVLAVVAAALLALRYGAPDRLATAAGGESASAAWTPAPRPRGETVALEIDFGNGARRQFDDLPWTADMTVGDLLRTARQFQPAITFQHDGAGAKAFLTSLEGVANEGPGGRFWTYEINGRVGEVSFDVQPLQPGDRVLWKFAPAG